MRTLVTGANRGIGLALCQLLKGEGHEVIAACRASSPELDRLGVEVFTEFDQCSPERISALANRVGATGLDVLINCAGVLARQTLGHIDAEAVQQIRQQFDTNAIKSTFQDFAQLSLFQRG